MVASHTNVTLFLTITHTTLDKEVHQKLLVCQSSLKFYLTSSVESEFLCVFHVFFSHILITKHTTKVTFQLIS